MHSRTLESISLISGAVAVDLIAYSRDGDPLAVVEIPRREAERLVRLPEAMGHVFKAARRRGGRVEVGAVRGLCPEHPRSPRPLESDPLGALTRPTTGASSV